MHSLLRFAQGEIKAKSATQGNVFSFFVDFCRYMIYNSSNLL